MQNSIAHTNKHRKNISFKYNKQIFKKEKSLFLDYLSYIKTKE